MKNPKINQMDRRNFMKKSMVAGAFSFAAGRTILGSTGIEAKKNRIYQEEKEPFKLKYAPGFGAFRHLGGDNWKDRLKFMSDQGFTAMFDNSLMDKPPLQQEEIAKLMDQLGMTLGPFVLYADFNVESFVLDNAGVREMLVNRMKEGIETAKRTNARWALVVPGRYNQRMEWDYQTANVIENLRMCSEIMQKEEIILVIEPLNPHDHPGLFLTRMPQAYSICRAVNNPSCKIIDDIYHQQITEGNLIPNIDRSWSEIASFHVGDTPGRNEPTTGEINYRNIFKHLYEKKYTGVICMEHGISQSGPEGEKILLEAYRTVDDF
ncbi:MAG: TIM barrel protein [Bacteroidales bacterium]|nr:MAG: TIM barrel protein [Bacteroidales bacterium]